MGLPAADSPQDRDRGWGPNVGATRLVDDQHVPRADALGRARENTFSFERGHVAKNRDLVDPEVLCNLFERRTDAMPCRIGAVVVEDLD